MISAHEYTLAVAGQRLPIKSGRVTLDEGWSPYAQATVTLALPDATALAQLDPRRGGRGRLSLAARYGSPTPLSAMTDKWAGQPLSALTAAYAGQSLRTISASLSTPYNAAGHRDSSLRVLDLAVVERRIDRRAGEVTLELASDEAYLQDFRATTPLNPGAWTVRAAVGLALAQIGAILQPGPADGTVTGESAVWEVGTTAWDYAHSLVDAAGLRLWCDERRRWWLTPPLTPDTAPDVYVVQPQTSEDLDEVLSREEWATGVIVTYQWETSAGRQTQHDVAGSGPRHLQIQVPRPFPGAGAAAAILARVRARGSIVSARAVSSYDVTPGWVMQSLSTDTAHLAGLVSSVTWDLDTDSVRVASRDLTDTPPRAWIIQPSGYRWSDVPPGLTWQNYSTPIGV